MCFHLIVHSTRLRCKLRRRLHSCMHVSCTKDVYNNYMMTPSGTKAFEMDSRSEVKCKYCKKGDLPNNPVISRKCHCHNGAHLGCQVNQAIKIEGRIPNKSRNWGWYRCESCESSYPSGECATLFFKTLFKDTYACIMHCCHGCYCCCAYCCWLLVILADCYWRCLL